MRPDRYSALRRTTRIASSRRERDRGIALENLGVADHGIERRAQLVAQSDDVAALRLAGGFRRFLGLLQLGVGALVRLDLLHQQFGLALGLLLGDAAALVHQHEDPGRDRGDDRQDEEHRPQRRFEDVLLHVRFERDLEIDEGEHGADDRGEQQEHADILADVGVHRLDDAARQACARPSRRSGSRAAPPACSNRDSGFRASSTASRSARNRPGTAPCPRARRRARRCSSAASTSSGTVQGLRAR